MCDSEILCFTLCHSHFVLSIKLSTAHQSGILEVIHANCILCSMQPPSHQCSDGQLRKLCPHTAGTHAPFAVTELLTSTPLGFVVILMQ